MKTFLMVHAALFSLALFLLLAAAGLPIPGAIVGLAWAGAWSVKRRGLRWPAPFEAALILAFLVIASTRLAGGFLSPRTDHALLFAALAVGATVSVHQGRPWTAEFSRAEYGSLSETPLFGAINGQMSALWAVLFGWTALALAIDVPSLWRWAPIAFGGVLTVFLPRLLMRRAMSRMAAGDRRNDWPSPLAASPTDLDGDVDVAVIGAGVGGLTAAALLADAGFRVAVFEQHVVAGGFAHHWVRRARTRDPATGKPLLFRFDSGVHDVSGWHEGGQLRALFRRLGIEDAIQWSRLDHRYVIGGRTIDVPRDWRSYADMIAEAFPGEASGIRTLFDDIHAVYLAMSSTGADRGGVLGLPRTPDGLLEFARNHPLAVGWMERRWTDFVARRVADPQARRWIDALAGYVTDDPSSATVARMAPIFGYYFSGGNYPLGGSGRIAEALVGAIEARGGVVRLRTLVQSIDSVSGAVAGLTLCGRDGTVSRISTKAVVANADFGALTGSLLDDRQAAAELLRQAGEPAAACSAAGVVLGLAGRLDLPPIIHVETATGYAVLAIPSAIDVSAAPAGYSTLEILEILAPEEALTWFPPGWRGDEEALAAFRRSIEYRAKKRSMGDRLIAAARRIVPDIDARIVYRAESSPLTFRRYALTTSGAIYGVKAKDGATPTKAPLRGLVMAGAATHGPGIEAVAMSGAHAAEALAPGLLAAPAKLARRPESPSGARSTSVVRSLESGTSPCPPVTSAT